WLEGIHPLDLSHRMEVFSSASDRLEEFRTDYRLRRHDGEYRWIEDIGAPRFGMRGEFLGYVGSCTDIHDRKMSELLLKGSKAELERLTFVAAHDLREPLRVVSLYNELISQRIAKSHSSSAEIKMLASHSHSAARRAQDVL